MSKAERRRAKQVRRIQAALAAAMCGGMRVEMYPGGVVVNDGDSMFTARPGDVLRGAAKVRAGIDAIRRETDDPAEQSCRAYDRLCAVTPVLSRGDAAERARHARVVKAWRREHPGCAGNWA
jgi:hypothetical protein